MLAFDIKFYSKTLLVLGLNPVLLDLRPWLSLCEIFPNFKNFSIILDFLLYDYTSSDSEID